MKHGNFDDLLNQTLYLDFTLALTDLGTLFCCWPGLRRRGAGAVWPPAGRGLGVRGPAVGEGRSVDRLCLVLIVDLCLEVTHWQDGTKSHNVKHAYFFRRWTPWQRYLYPWKYLSINNDHLLLKSRLADRIQTSKKHDPDQTQIRTHKKYGSGFNPKNRILIWFQPIK